MNAFLLLYAMALSIEFVLSLLMAFFLFLVVGFGDRAQPPTARDAPPAPDAPARTVEGALGAAFVAVAEGHDDLLAITNARALLARYARDQRSEIAS